MSMSVILLGTGVAIPQPGRSQAALLVREAINLLFDCGAGTLVRLSDARISPLEIHSVFLTHLHLDHVSDLLPLAKARYLEGEISTAVYGPPGTKRWIKALLGIYPYLDKIEICANELFPEEGTSADGLEISTAQAAHSVTALSYRIEGDGSLVYSGDTEPIDDIADMARGSDLLVHECSFPEPFQVSNHSTPVRLGEKLCGVKRIALTHFYPQSRGYEKDMAAQVARISGGEVFAGEDLMEICL